MTIPIPSLLKTLTFGIVLVSLTLGCRQEEPPLEVDVLVIGGGTGGVAAGLQAARLHARTLIVEQGEWLGGMLTAAGVSATDGNHHMPAGIWGEFRQRIYDHYGGPASVATGWVSHTQFEPRVGATIFREMADQEASLDVWFNTRFVSLDRAEGRWEVRVMQQGEERVIRPLILIDGTDLGDVAAAAGAAYDLGMDARSTTGEAMAPEQANNIVQDLTYAAILKDYGPGIDKSIPVPEGYDPALFRCCCRHDCEDEQATPCETMITYGKLPNDKYMINWPRHGNDYYVNAALLPEEERQEAYRQAKLRTLGFIYYLQHELGMTQLGLADDEFPTPDLLPLLPYHREGRRIRGLVGMNVNHILDPFGHPSPLYRTGIAVGDYPIDHHHQQNPEAPEIDFPPVPSFNIPMGCLIPEQVPFLLVADKAISVTNIVNGSSRLQPVVLQIGQAAGALAALAIQEGKNPADLEVRKVQETLLEAGAYLMPYYDVKPDHPHFGAIQRIGATGLLKGHGEPYQWANRTWFYPDTTITREEARAGLQLLAPDISFGPGSAELLKIDQVAPLLLAFAGKVPPAGFSFSDEAGIRNILAENWLLWSLSDYRPDRPISRTEWAVILDRIFQPFQALPVDIQGDFMK